MSEVNQDRISKLLNEWHTIQETEVWAMFQAGWAKAEKDAIDFVLTTADEQKMFTARGQVAGIRQAVGVPKRVIDELREKQG